MKIKELMKFLKQSFIDNKKIFLIVLLKSVFLSFSSLFLVVGLGTIVEQLLDGNNLISLLQPIFLYSFIPLIINLIATSLTFYIDYLTRISTNKIQYDYVDDALTVNYHYVQDGEILNLKRRSMSGHTIFYIDIIGQLLQQFFQIIGTIFLFSFMSPWYIIAIFIIQIIIIYLNYLKRKISFNFNNDITDSNRKLDYIYHVMTDYKYGKDIDVKIRFHIDSYFMNEIDFDPDAINLYDDLYYYNNKYYNMYNKLWDSNIIYKDCEDIVNKGIRIK